MAQATVSARIDSKDKEKFDKLCDKVGLDIEALKKGIEQLNAGKGVEHELIEVDDQ